MGKSFETLGNAGALGASRPFLRFLDLSGLIALGGVRAKGGRSNGGLGGRGFDDRDVDAVVVLAEEGALHTLSTLCLGDAVERPGVWPDLVVSDCE